jgi:hypothetical protein
MKLLLLLSAMTMLAAPVNAHPWPVWPDSTYHQVSATYGVWTGSEDQGYPSYMHSGADIDVPFPTPVYAIQPGYVKAVLTTQAGNPTGAPYYWRILIGDSSGTQPATPGCMRTANIHRGDGRAMGRLTIRRSYYRFIIPE